MDFGLLPSNFFHLYLDVAEKSFFPSKGKELNNKMKCKNDNYIRKIKVRGEQNQKSAISVLGRTFEA